MIAELFATLGLMGLVEVCFARGTVGKVMAQMVLFLVVAVIAVRLIGG